MIIITLSTHSSSAFHRWKSNRPSLFLDDDQDWWDHLSVWMFQAKDQWCYKQLQTVIFYWLVVYLPLLKLWVRKLGWLLPIYGKIKKCAKPPTSIAVICPFYHHFRSFKSPLNIVVSTKNASRHPAQRDHPVLFVIFLMLNNYVYILQTVSICSSSKEIKNKWDTNGYWWDINGIFICYLVGGWALPLWKMMEFVSWDDYSQYMESHKSHDPNQYSCYMPNHLEKY